MIESNGVGSIFVGWGMSIASKRAKERQNRSSDELVMDKTKISRSLKLQVTNVRKWTDVRSSDVREGSKIRKNCSGMVVPVVQRVADVRGFEGGPDVRKTPVVQGSGSTRDARSGTRFWAKNGDFGVKIDEISWMKDGETRGDARST